MAVQYLCCTLLHTLSIATIGPFIAFPFLTPEILYNAPLVQPLLLYQKCDLAPCTITQLSLVHTQVKQNNKKSMYKNTVIQQKDSVATCIVAGGAMAPFTGQIRTSQEQKNTSLPEQKAPTDGRESM